MRKAMIFAAGLGKRLEPLTHTRPKALVELEGKTLLQRTIEKLIHAGISTIVINIHHFAPLMRQTIESMHVEGVKLIISDESTQLLDTGGGLLKAARYLKDDQPVLLHNVDILSAINLDDMLQNHLQSGALATLAVSRRETARSFLWHQGQLCGWQNTQTGQQMICYDTPERPLNMAFSGIHILNPGIFDLISETGKFSINKLYLRLAASQKIMACEHDPQYWADLGTTQKLALAAEMLKQNPGLF